MQFKTSVKELEINVTFENKKTIKNLYLKVIDDENIHIKAGKYFTPLDSKRFIE